MKDEKIIDKIQKGETELFDSIIRKYYQSIYRFKKENTNIFSRNRFAISKKSYYGCRK